MRGRAGTVKFEGDYRYDAEVREALAHDNAAAHSQGCASPFRSCNWPSLESLMMPALRRNEGFLARAFRRDRPLPKWLEERDADDQRASGRA